MRRRVGGIDGDHVEGAVAGTRGDSNRVRVGASRQLGCGERRRQRLDRAVRPGELGADRATPAVGEVADAVRAAGDRQPGFGPHRRRRRIERPVTAALLLHRGDLEPLEGRLAAGDPIELALGVEDVAEGRTAPALERVEVEPDDVREGQQHRIHLLSLRQWLGSAVEMVGQGEEADAAAARVDGRPELVTSDRAVEGRVPLVRVVPADQPASVRVCVRGVNQRVRAAAEQTRKGDVFPVAAETDEEVDPVVDA